MVWTPNFSDLKDSNIVVEAVNENFDLKKSIFEELAKITDDHTILASNTSSICNLVQEVIAIY